MKNEWVDFKAIKEAVSIQMVLDHYGIRNLRKSGDELRGPCPIHKAAAKSKNFSVNLSKNAFTCFADDCRARGNVLDFVVAMEGGSVRDAAVKLSDWFKVGDDEPKSKKTVEKTNLSSEVTRGIYRDEEGAFYEVVITSAITEDLERLVVYRELFDQYVYRTAAPEDFGQDSNSQATFTLLKPL